MPDLSVIILSYNTRDLLERCLACLFAAARAASIRVDVIVVDNGSTDGSVEFVSRHVPPVVLIQNAANVGFATANNQGLAAVKAPVALLLNSDAFVTSVVLDRAMDLLVTSPEVGMVGVRLDNPDGTIQAEFGTFPSLIDDVVVSLGLDRLRQRRTVSPAAAMPVDWVQGACMFVRMTAVHDAGPLDTRFFMYSEEVDWCRRFWNAGWAVWYLADVSVMHLGSASSRNDDLLRRRALYQSRLGLRRRLSGPLPAVVLWSCMLTGLCLRAMGRFGVQVTLRRSIGRHAASADWALMRAVLRMDPLARWAGG
jgi:GT2 family glycosyltransferase